MITTLRRFWTDERAQDLVEYSLLIAFIALALVQLIVAGGKSMNGIWASANSNLTTANTAITAS